uniref:Mtn3/RAG1IP-like protein, putative n=1 Tax=Babesia bovis TaxID=5865 RepID=S6B9K1_BABBO|nr:Mtn3/RAG1IP-like protein, putative [Babesia bovis]
MPRKWRLAQFWLLGIALIRGTVICQDDVNNDENIIGDGILLNVVSPSPEHTEPLKPITSSPIIRDMSIADAKETQKTVMTGEAKPKLAFVDDSSENNDIVETAPDMTKSSTSINSSEVVQRQPIVTHDEALEANDDNPGNTPLVGRLMGGAREMIQTDFNYLIGCGTVLSSIITQLIPLHTVMTVRYNKSTGNLKTLNFVTVAFANFLWSLYGLICYNTVIILSSIPSKSI